MLKRVTIKNFQIHKDTVIDFTEGVNVISGPSDNGKSTVIRAIRWVLENRPSGFDFKRDAAKPSAAVEVKLEFDNGWVLRHRTEKENYYIVCEGDNEPLKLKALRSDVPDEVRAITKCGEYNVQYQLDSHFLFNDDSSGGIAKRLNVLAGVDVIDDILKLTNKKIKDANGKEKAYQEMLVTKKVSLKNDFKNIPKAEKIIGAALLIEEERKEFAGYKTDLRILCEKIDELNKKPVIDIDKAAEQVAVCATVKTEMVEMVSGRVGLTAICNKLTGLNAALATVLDFEACAAAITAAKQHADALKSYRTDRLALASKLDKAHKAISGSMAAVIQRKKAIDALAKFRLEVKTCPVCKKPW